MLPEIEAVETAVTKPLPLTVTTGIEVVEPNVPTLLLTVTNVVVRLPAVVVKSPVNAGDSISHEVPVS
jgi:hypothetical protein